MNCIHSAKKGTISNLGKGIDENGKYQLQSFECRKCGVIVERKIYPYVLADVFSIPKDKDGREKIR
ncbi:MAG: hypothetical protein ABSF48_00160 [Thermodesulfobacteriota bacterium]|jgi:hypothetical protein